MKKRVYFAGSVAMFALGASSAHADNIALNQWYTAHSFGLSAPEPLQGGTPIVVAGTNGPVLGGGFADSVNAPAGTSWTITLTGFGTLTVTDLEEEGDRFQMFDNGVAMSSAASPFNAAGQNPGNSSPGGGLTSVPCFDCGNLDVDINASLGTPTMSSGTFRLKPGVNVITGNWVGDIGPGDMAFIAESAAVPEPGVWVMLLGGFGLIGARARLQRRKARAV